ncbi:putative dehydrogenase [Shimia isoporae]|uniref:Putative dehydrogenase n=1 Tax=Shimia isoporae TaxID=647720 RepID=A0A4R1N164_9RHOB|nr:Gfo/Idh/MocA family oxidoreductase [Shimia isoporae]TCK99777.1 putative dehydrogenase [Shimia isoporae]
MIRWGVVGTGFISHAMLGAIAKSERSVTTAVAGRNETALSGLQAQYAIPNAFTDIADLLSSDDVDVVYIALPNHMHADVTTAVINAGKPVLCEKSLTVTMADANRLSEAVEPSGLFFAEGLMYLAHPLITQLVSLLQDPSFGDLRSVSGSYAADIWKVVNPAGGGTLYNLGCYPASLLHLVVQTMCGEKAFAQRRIAAFGSLNKDGNIQDTAATVRFDNGVMATLQSTDSHGMSHSFEIVTTKGMLRFATNPWLPAAGDNRMIWQPFEGPAREIVVTDDNDAFYHQTRMVERALASGAAEAPRPSPRLKDSMEIMQFLADWEAAARG